ncbi:hypothetical protein J3R82DRAFT_8908 [Butyriboletus roseoflavus]|nr:hypothetical protein J3R82DRAFT_8908 [Butyriboletus roseoflavus]
MFAYDSPLHMSDNTTPLYDTRGRQKGFVESTVQRRERIEFLKQREWVRRVTQWVRETNAQKDSPIFGRSGRSFIPFPNQDTALGSQAFAIPFPRVEEEEEEEPYVIYSSSPNSSLTSLSEEITPVLPLNSGPSPSLTAAAPQPAQRRASGHHRRCSSASLRGHARQHSLSSICEVPEED